MMWIFFRSDDEDFIEGLMMVIFFFLRSNDEDFIIVGEEVNWVQCDRCEEWYHLLCVGLGADEVTEDEEYECFKCKNQDSSLAYLHSSVSADEVVRNTLRETITISTSSGITTTREGDHPSVSDVELSDKTNTVPQKIIRTQSPIKIQEFCSQKSLAGKLSERGVKLSVIGSEDLSSVISSGDILEEPVPLEEEEEDRTNQNVGGEGPSHSVVVADIMDGMMSQLESPVPVSVSSVEETVTDVIETNEQADET
jgi:histone demethylase JARID1